MSRPAGRVAGFRRPVCWAVRGVIVVFAGSAAGVARCDDLRILSTHVVPAESLTAGVVLGGLSDLSLGRTDAGEQAVGPALWVITDRGPNGTAGEGDAKRRTLLAQDFVPAIVRLRLPKRGDAVVEQVLPLAGISGKAFSGRPNGVGRDEPILDAAGATAGGPRPDGRAPQGRGGLPPGAFQSWAGGHAPSRKERPLERLANNPRYWYSPNPPRCAVDSEMVPSAESRRLCRLTAPPETLVPYPGPTAPRSTDMPPSTVAGTMLRSTRLSQATFRGAPSRNRAT